MTNYAKLGEYTALKQQAMDAAGKRFAILHNLAAELHRLREQYETPIDLSHVNRELACAEEADNEMRAAVKQANEAAPLCGQPKITLNWLMKDYAGLKWR
ncbi:hypothetical protein IQ454_004700 [Salmonella enterica]|nr:hypothetical protein [Salmonella enterica]ECP0306129.1 hypothetical protein [Salmonella enterica]EDO5382745.1 hypothetical protein [Salmonella enterica]EGL4350566.1 hypothetical protein [Salmonella enterica]EGL4359888.1 hypothetical protein [Salmonella enterica]